MKEDCKHEYEILDIVYSEKYYEHTNSAFIRYTTYYCKHCLQEIEVVKKESGKEIPHWFRCM